MEIVSDHKRSKVYYNEGEKTYVKTFHPKFKNRLKYGLKLRKSPGKNFKFISSKLKEIGIRNPEILKYSDYYVITKEVEGVVFRDYIKNNPCSSVVQKVLDSIVLMIKNNIYCGDLNTGNFIIANTEIYAIDLEGYRKTRVLPRKKEDIFKRLKNTLKNKEWTDYILERI